MINKLMDAVASAILMAMAVLGIVTGMAVVVELVSMAKTAFMGLF